MVSEEIIVDAFHTLFEPCYRYALRCSDARHQVEQFLQFSQYVGQAEFNRIVSEAGFEMNRNKRFRYRLRRRP